MTRAEQPALTGISQVSMRAHDLGRAVDFYHDVLGLGLLSAQEDMAFLLAGSVRIMLAITSAPEHDHPGSILYFDTPDIERDFAILEQRGVAVLRSPHAVHQEDNHALWLAFFYDSEGNTLALSQWRRLPG